VHLYVAYSSPSAEAAPLSTAGRFSLMVMIWPDFASTMEVHWYSR